MHPARVHATALLLVFLLHSMRCAHHGCEVHALDGAALWLLARTPHHARHAGAFGYVPADPVFRLLYE